MSTINKPFSCLIGRRFEMPVTSYSSPWVFYKKMKTFIVLLIILPLSFHLFSQENRMTKIEIPEKWAVDFDKNKLDSLYPESEFKVSPITGIWVEENMETDTLIFKPYYDGQYPILYLERGQRSNNSLPKYYCGPYHYRLEDGAIRTQWYLSSSITYNPYYIKISNDSSEMRIGNFYDSAPQNYDTLTFIRVD